MTCRHCGRVIVYEDGAWIDPNATGDDSMWRETCDSHDTFTAEHEPTEAEPWGKQTAHVAQVVRIDEHEAGGGS